MNCRPSNPSQNRIDHAVARGRHLQSLAFADAFRRLARAVAGGLDTVRFGAPRILGAG